MDLTKLPYGTESRALTEQQEGGTEAAEVSS
jgi:hypothetical protein